MTVKINCDTCNHYEVCKFSATAKDINSQFRDETPPPFMLTISCPHYSSLYYSASFTTLTGKNRNVDAYPTEIAKDCAHVNSTSVLEATSAPEAYPTATLREGYHAR